MHFLIPGRILQMLGRRKMLLDCNLLAGSGVDACQISAPENVFELLNPVISRKRGMCNQRFQTGYIYIYMRTIRST